MPNWAYLASDRSTDYRVVARPQCRITTTMGTQQPKTRYASHKQPMMMSSRDPPLSGCSPPITYAMALFLSRTKRSLREQNNRSDGPKLLMRMSAVKSDGQKLTEDLMNNV